MSDEPEPFQLCLTWQDPLTGEYCQCVEPLPVLIGRATSVNTIVLKSKLVSRQHVRLEGLGGKIVLVDLDSTNGTFLNGQPVKQATLSDGNCFQIGPFIFTAATFASIANS